MISPRMIADTPGQPGTTPRIAIWVRLCDLEDGSQNGWFCVMHTSMLENCELRLTLYRGKNAGSNQLSTKTHQLVEGFN